jgi:hypothetical protein
VVSFTLGLLYPRGKSSRYPLYRRLGGPQSRSERHGEVKILAPPELELRLLRPPPRSQFAIPTVLCRILEISCYNKKINKFIQNGAILKFCVLAEIMHRKSYQWRDSNAVTAQPGRCRVRYEGRKLKTAARTRLLYNSGSELAGGYRKKLEENLTPVPTTKLPRNHSGLIARVRHLHSLLPRSGMNFSTARSLPCSGMLCRVVQ